MLDVEARLRHELHDAKLMIDVERRNAHEFTASLRDDDARTANVMREHIDVITRKCDTEARAMHELHPEHYECLNTLRSQSCAMHTQSAEHKSALRRVVYEMNEKRR